MMISMLLLTLLLLYLFSLLQQCLLSSHVVAQKISKFFLLFVWVFEVFEIVVVLVFFSVLLLISLLAKYHPTTIKRLYFSCPNFLWVFPFFLEMKIFFRKRRCIYLFVFIIHVHRT